MPMDAQLIPRDYFRKLEAGEIFPDTTRPLEVDLGCGDGGFITAMAEHHRDRNFLAVERLLGRVKKVCRKAGQLGLENLRALRLESAYTIGWLLPDGCVSRLHLLCPDPWPKKKHHRRRLFNDPEFQSGLMRVLSAGGEFLLKSDHDEYFEEAEFVIGNLPGLERLPWDVDEFYYPLTDFEKQWIGVGRTIKRARWAKQIPAK